MASFGRPEFEQDLPLKLKEEGIVGCLGQQPVGFGHRFVGVSAEVIGISARIMSGDALVAFGIANWRILRVDIADQLGLDPLEPRLDRRVGGRIPRWILFVDLGQRIDALARKRMVRS